MKLKQRRFHLFENKYYWIMFIIALLTMVPKAKERIGWYCLAIVLCSTLLFSWIEITPKNIISYFRKNVRQSIPILLFSILHSVVLSRSFYLMWLPSIQLDVFASRFHLSGSQFFNIIILFVFPCIVCSSFVLLSYLLKRYQQDDRRSTEIVLVFCFALLEFLLSQGISCGVIGTLAVQHMICGTLIVVALIMLMSMITASIKTSVLLGTLPFLLFSTINYYVYLFRGREICPYDLLSIGTAMNVVSEYQFVFSLYLQIGWLGWVFLMTSLFLTKREAKSNRKTIRLYSSVILLLSVVIVFCLEKDTTVKTWLNSGSTVNGTVLNFFLQLRDSRIQSPNNYSPETLQELEQKYQTNETAEDDLKPSIIVIMNESFTDFNVMGNDVQTGEALLPYTASLRENTIRGYAYSSVYGGNTANSEFEFLTGNSMAFLPYGSVPYQQYLSDHQYSLLTSLHSAGYHCVATHPFSASGWNRPKVYDWFGFDETTFISDYPQNNLVRNYVSDREMYEYVSRKYEERDKSAGFFLFGITIQNHGGYTYVNYEPTVSLSYPKHYPEAEQYLSLAKLSDQAVEYLIDYFSNVPDPVVICFFGDHQPRVEAGFLETLHGGDFGDLDSEMLKYKVPFFIWANYDIEERTDVETSINYLSTHLLEVCGIKLPAYNQFLKDAEERIPILTGLGYYSVSKGGFLPISAATGEEKEMLNQYYMLEYNNLFDKEQESRIFQMP